MTAPAPAPPATPLTLPGALPATPLELPGTPPADPLAELRDIHLPDAVPFWPLAPGWWLAVGLLALLLLVAALLEWRRRQTLGYRALKELEAIERDGARYADAHAVARAAAVLVRRIVMTRGDRSRLALSGDDWQRFLAGGKAGLPQPMARFMALAPYVPPAAAAAAGIDRAQLLASLRRWIRGNA
ncbi:DUF4381 domain-containing protein [Chelatococcus reniformis]|uniref:DUF4381 domain-containing protein n=1 Tax=Chelatococcus reniformis TaxID=1494448 RepID=A0A916URD1_9HYPH|nr:DUF4381 domain-containing protein [Chelatococcus reniformis]GGC81405.1 hypothetical protein GCM10010994_44220 [Chelatococcus reniformis]